MPKETFFTRFTLIIRRLEKGPATFEEISHYLETESDIQGKDFNISMRTFQRDIKDIYEQLNYEIVNERTGEKRYYIKNRPETNEHSKRLLESFQLIQALRAAQHFTDKVYWETRKPNGLEHFEILLFAINNKRVVHFCHYKYWDDVVKKRVVHPLGLKESQGRWYLLAVDTTDRRLKTFGLDRISELEVREKPYREKYAYDLKNLFNHAFGILVGNEQEPEMVQLKYEFEQGQYVKNYPLHPSQKVIREDGKEVVIELIVYITYDFMQELLSYGPELEVLKPLSLRKEMKKQLMKTVLLYEK
jgi:proteasome accessory factor B